MQEPSTLSALFDPAPVGAIALGFAINLLFVAVIVRFIYLPRHQRSDYAFTQFLLNTVTFFLCFLLRKIPVELGLGLGLFAVFGILRYRTESVPIRDLTYLFVVIALGIINAIAGVNLGELLFVNVAVVLLTFLLETRWGGGGQVEHSVTYDRLDLLDPNKREELCADLRARTGLNIERVSIARIDLLRDTAELSVAHRGDGTAGLKQGDQ